MRKAGPDSSTVGWLRRFAGVIVASALLAPAAWASFFYTGQGKLEIVKAEYGAGSTQRDVTLILQKQAGDLQLISLPSANYNEAFGGDPAAGAAKRAQPSRNSKPSSTAIRIAL